MTKKKYRTTTGAVVLKDPEVVAAFPEGAYVEVPDDTPLGGAEEPCCGEQPKTEKTARKEQKNG